MPVEHDNAKEDAGMGGGGGGSTIDDRHCKPGLRFNGASGDHSYVVGECQLAKSAGRSSNAGSAGERPLSGTYPNPGAAEVDGVAVSGTPSVGKVLTATSSTAADWQTPSVRRL